MGHEKSDTTERKGSLIKGPRAIEVLPVDAAGVLAQEVPCRTHEAPLGRIVDVTASKSSNIYVQPHGHSACRAEDC